MFERVFKNIFPKDSEEERSGNKEWSDNWQEAGYQAGNAGKGLE